MRGCVLGVDVGVASLGAALIEVEIINGRMIYRGIIDGVSHIFPPAQGGAERRQQVAMRKSYQRQTLRLNALRKRLAQFFEVSSDFDDQPTDLGQAYVTACKSSDMPVVLSPNSRFRLRATGLTEKLSAGDLARTILHLAKNRGMRLTRAFDNGRDEKAGKQAQTEAVGMAREAQETAGSMKAHGVVTPGAFLWKIEQSASEGHKRPALRHRKGRVGGYLFTRQQVEAEFDAILKAQSGFHPELLTPEKITEIREQVFWEKDAPDPKVGPCLYFIDDLRIPIASDLFQNKRIYEEVNSILIKHSNEARRRLTIAQRELLVAELLAGENLKVSKIKKLLGLDRGLELSLEAGYGKRTEAREIKGHRIIVEFRKVQGLLDMFRSLSPVRQRELVELLRTERDREVAIVQLVSGFGLSDVMAHAVMDEVVLPTGYAATGARATEMLFETLRDEVMPDGEYAGRVMLPWDAEQFLGLERVGAQIVSQSRLPYYGKVFPNLVRDRMTPGDKGFDAATNEQKFGRIPNPVVHVAMTRMRKVVNGLLKKYAATYGQPIRVHVEFSREMSMSDDERAKYERRIQQEHKQNQEDDAEIIRNGGVPSRKARRMLRLAREQNWCCPYSLRQIAPTDLFKDFDLDHILPRAETLDDSLGNLVVVCRDSNRVKGKKSPFEAFGDGRDYERDDGKKISHEQMINYVRSCKGMAHKAWRFGPDAMDRFRDEKSFGERYLNDTRYIAKCAAQYLQCICRPGAMGAVKPVVALNGRIVSDLRYGWGLRKLVEEIAEFQEPDIYAADADGKTGKKDRRDHRHHLLDAIVTALTPYDLVRQLKDLAREKLKAGNDRIGNLVPRHPWEGFQSDIRDFIAQINASHRANRNLNAQMHEATGLGVIARLGDGSYLTRTRKRLDPADFTDPQKLEDVISVPDRIVMEMTKAVGDPKAQVFWSSSDPVGDLQDIAEDLEKVRDDILSLYETQPESETQERTDDEPLIRKLKPEERLGRAIRQYVKQTGRRTVKVFGTAQAVVIDHNDREVPTRTYRPGNNAWLDLYRAEDGKTSFEVVRTIDAMRPGFVPAWSLDGGNHLLLRLYQGDTVEITDKTGQRRRCVFRENSPGDWSFQPVNLAVNVRDTSLRSRLRFRSFKGLLAADPRLVVTDIVGNPVWRSPARNW